MINPSIFTKIINGEIPCHKIYEDEKTLAFLDINPVAPGHTLVVPKTEVEFVWDMNDTDYHAVMETVKRVAKRIKEVLQTPYVGDIIVGTDVPHAHVHVVGFSHAGELKRTHDGPGAPADDTSLAEMAEKLRF